MRNIAIDYTIDYCFPMKAQPFFSILHLIDITVIVYQLSLMIVLLTYDVIFNLIAFLTFKLIKIEH